MRSSALAICGLSLSLALAAAVAGTGAMSSRLPADVDVVLEHVDEDSGAIEAVIIEIEYSGETSIDVSPLVSGSRSDNIRRWRPHTITLTPGIETVELRAPTPDATISANSATVWLTTGRQLASHSWTVVPS